MADVADTLAEWSSTTASNAPDGTASIGTGLDDNLREIQGVITRGLSHKGADIASVAGTTDIGAVEGLMHDITGALAITGLGTVRAGILKVLKFEGAATLTHNATSLILPGASNIVCADGDVGIFISEGSGNWRCLDFQPAAYTPKRPVLGTAQATTSGTSIDFTGLPSWARRITLNFSEVSTSGTSDVAVQLGDAGGVENSGYLGSVSTAGAASVATANATTSAQITNGHSGGTVMHGRVVCELLDASTFTWTITSVMGESGTQSSTAAYSKSTSAALDRIRITTVGGADTFDAGKINVLYE